MTDTETTSERDPGRGRGNLERDIVGVILKVEDGTLALEDGEKLTPHRIGKLIKEQDGLEKAPSTGAVSACLDRWSELKVASVGNTPKVFKNWSANVRNADNVFDAIDDAKLKRRERTKKDRAAAKAAAAAEDEGTAEVA